MPDHTVAVIRSGFDDAAGLDSGVSHALLEEVSAGELPETFRIHQPTRVVAFGKQDRLAPGFDRAVQITRDLGFHPIVRMPGGRAVVFHEETIAFSWTIPSPDPVRGIRERFQAATSVIVRALGDIGVPAAAGEIPGEYCPGEFSVNHAGRIKLAGIGQRLARHAAHVGGVLVVGNTETTRAVLVPTYRALRIDWDPDTVGSIHDIAPGIEVSDMIDAIVRVVGEEAAIMPASIGAATLASAREYAPLHIP
ncbi:MAG: lipoate--protein ligase family protein [Acidimicrobiia bacterium]